MGDRERIALGLNNLGATARDIGDYGRATELLEESLRLSREQGNEIVTANALITLGLTALAQEEHLQAEEQLKESLTVMQRSGHKLGIAACLEALAGLAGAQGLWLRAARLEGASVAAWEATGALLDPGDRAIYERHLRRARSQLGEAAWQAAWTVGRNMPLDEATAYALEYTEQISSQPRHLAAK